MRFIYLIPMVIGTIILGCISASAVDKTKTHRTFENWLLSCSDAEICSANTASDSGDNNINAQLYFQRKRDDSYLFFIRMSDILLDRNRPVNLRILGGDVVTFNPVSDYAAFGNDYDLYFINPKNVQGLVAAMLKAKAIRFEFLDVAGEAHDAVFQLTGLKDALTWIDERQNRIGKKRVFAARPNDLSPLPLMNKQQIVLRSGLPSMLLEYHAQISDCEDVGSQHLINYEAIRGVLSQTALLYGLPCSTGAYNIFYRFYVVESGEIGGITPLYFADYVDDFGWIGSDILVNASYDSKTKVLTSFNKARGLGDCGSRGTWRWRDYAFEMVEFRAETACQGKAVDRWPILYSKKKL